MLNSIGEWAQATHVFEIKPTADMDSDKSFWFKLCRKASPDRDKPAMSSWL